MLARWSRSNRIALGVLLGAALATAYAAVPGAEPTLVQLSLGEIPSTPAPPKEVTAPIHPRADAQRLANMVLETVMHDPFRADRRRPSGRYGALVPPSALPVSVSQPTSPLPPLQLSAVAATPRGRSVAALQVAGGPARIIHIGDEIEGLHVIAIRPGEVRLRGADTTVVLRLPDAATPPPVY